MSYKYPKFIITEVEKDAYTKVRKALKTAIPPKKLIDKFIREESPPDKFNQMKAQEIRDYFWKRVSGYSWFGRK